MSKKTFVQPNNSKYLNNSGSLKSASEVPALFLSKKHLAVTLGISLSYVDKLMADEGLPHYKIGRSVRFNLNEIMAFLERRKRP